ncbi:beta-N-acetylhexosaminidase [Alkalilimnicola ehrlichii]|uniref:beta-N-acetylhexosaminidase n=1 Tax=Alkalilimnicola ehrlichii TaxID=351052 RepID=UPI000E2ED614|nr:beta-N-acetylhexosaminidase [Alkalilimnicola ehrlichii]RFA24651.1 beta-N-acetylhexosaminidase [Alkalilimnicola ehrlichii]
MVGIEGAHVDAAMRDVLRHPAVGGVILFTRNFESAAQIAALCEEIHALREPRLLIAVDQEGGRVQRFQGEFQRLPAVARLGELYDCSPQQALELSELAGWLMAAELRATGVDISFAPILDLGRRDSRVIGDRAFHGEPEAIVALAQAYTHGMMRAGMAATGKHFPGHGSVPEDSHFELPRDPRSLADLAPDLFPFEQMIRAGLPALMMAHVIYEGVDSAPASFSRTWIQDILRDRYAFAGVVFSDDLGMQAAECVGDYRARTEAAIAAGCDMVLLCNDFEQIDAVLAVTGADPASSRRVESLLGKGSTDWAALRESKLWKSAVARLADL